MQQFKTISEGSCFIFKNAFIFCSLKKWTPELHSSLTHSKLSQIEIVSRNIIKMMEHHINKRWRFKTKGYNSFHYLEWDWKAAFHPFKKLSILLFIFHFCLAEKITSHFHQKTPQKSKLIWDFGQKVFSATFLSLFHLQGFLGLVWNQVWSPLINHNFEGELSLS